MKKKKSDIWSLSFKEAEKTLKAFLKNPLSLSLCEQFAQVLIKAFKNHKKVFICGNGGSHCDAMHFAEELTGRYEKNRRPLGALALGDPSHITCVSNDYGFEQIFSRQLEALANPQDVFIGLSTSGNSKNVVKAFEKAKELKLYTVALLGKTGGLLTGKADLSLLVPSLKSSRVQEIHIKILHIAVENVEKKLFSPQKKLQP